MTELVTIAEQTVEGIVITDTSGRIQYVNPAFTTITGYGSEESVGQYPKMLKSGHQPVEFYEELWNTIRSGRVWHGEVINRRKDGTLYHEEMRITPVRAAGGEVVSYIAIKQDVTERRAATEAQALLAAIVESSADAIIAYSASGTILTWNRGAEKTFGYPAGDAIGKPFSLLVPADRMAELARFTEQILRGECVSQHEGFCRREDGRKIRVSVKGCPIRNSDGSVRGISVIIRDISEQQEAEEARALLASIVESSDDAIVGASLDGVVVSWNRGAEALFRYSRQEMIGRNVEILAAPDRLDEVRRRLSVIREGRTVSPFETVHRRKDGTLVDVSICISPIRNSVGEVVGSSAIMRDIGRRLLAERNLRESEERFREVFEHAPFGMCVTRADGHFLQVNAVFCRMLGYSQEELLTKGFPELTHPDDLGTSLQMKYQLSANPDACVEGEKRYLHRNGTVVWVRVKISAVRDACGKVSYHLVHVEDITERQRTEEALHESEDRFRIMADSCPTMMWVTDARGGVQFINRAYRDFCGITYEEVAGERWRLLVHRDDATEYRKAFDRAVRDHAPFKAEARVRRADGEWRWVSSYAEPRLSPGGEFLGHVGLSPDIHERKQAEQERQFQLSLIRAIHEVSLDGILVVSDEGFVVSHNKRLLEVWQISLPDLAPERITGNPDQPLLSACTSRVKDTESFIRRVLELYDDPDADDHCEIELKDGRTLERYSTSLRSEKGQYLGRVWFFRDITERKQAEQALQRSEEQFREFAENIHEVFWMMPAAANEVLYVSPAYEQVWGRTRDSLYRDAMSWADAIHPDDAERAHAMFARQIQGEHVESEYRIRTPDGKEKWILDRAFPIRSEAGELVRVVGIAEEITERKLYEAELIRARKGADARSRVLEKINRREPLGDVLGAVSSLLKYQFPASEYCIYLSSGGNDFELVPESCSSPDLGRRLLQAPIRKRGAISARADIDSQTSVDRESQLAYSWPILDANTQIMGTISVFPHHPAVPDSLAEMLESTAQLAALAINNRRLYDGLTHQSHHDALTGLPNRVFLNEHLAALVEAAEKRSVNFVIAYIDLDEFKEVNDIYGHATGDAFLQIAASRLRSTLRKEDVLARIGGDEFIAVLAGINDRNEATQRGRRLLESLNEPFAINGSLRLPCTASIGMAIFPDDGSNIDELTHCADESMYLAKMAGKNLVQTCDPALQPKSRISAPQLRRTIEENRLCVHYQPVFLACGRLSGFEALVRLEEESGKLLVPAHFIDIAEKSSLIVPLGRSVLRQACRQAAVWERETRASLRMAVNVSARQFAHPAFFEEVLAVLSEFRLPESLLELEITEAAILKDLDGAIEQIQRLRSRGVRIAIDDFGTGYSTLSLVNSLPLDVIKIDRSFVQDMRPDGPSIHTIKAVLSLAAGLALRSVAEGVEHVQQLQTLLSLGCAAFQGFGFGRPMPASSIEDRLNCWLAPVPHLTHRLELASNLLVERVRGRPGRSYPRAESRELSTEVRERA